MKHRKSDQSESLKIAIREAGLRAALRLGREAQLAEEHRRDLGVQFVKSSVPAERAINST